MILNYCTVPLSAASLLLVAYHGYDLLRGHVLPALLLSRFAVMLAAPACRGDDDQLVDTGRPPNVGSPTVVPAVHPLLEAMTPAQCQLLKVDYLQRMLDLTKQSRNVSREMLALTDLGGPSSYDAEDIDPQVVGHSSDHLAAVRAMDRGGPAFRSIQEIVCRVRDRGCAGLSVDYAERVGEFYVQVTEADDEFHRQMIEYGCAVGGELYRRCFLA